MEPSVEIFHPSRQYARLGWAALAGSLVCVLWGFRVPLSFIPGLLCAVTAAAIFWLASRPPIRLGETQFNVGERAIAWREVREINRSRFNQGRFVSPLVLRIKLTNSRYKILIYPGDADRLERLVTLLRKNSHLATFDGVPYRDYWAWPSTIAPEPAATQPPTAAPPVHLFSAEDEEEIERLYQKLKTVGRLDSRGKDSSNNPNKD